MIHRKTVEAPARAAILVIMNDWSAPAGILGESILAAGSTYETRLPHEGYSSRAPHQAVPLPRGHDSFDGLVILGGAMSATDDARFPALVPLLALIRSFHEAEKPVLGVCLGAQLVARALGARVYPQGWLEAGFEPITLTAQAADDHLLAGLGPMVSLFEWHEDSFDLPEGAVLLATGARCRNQIFRAGRFTYGFQCHFEVNADIARHWVRTRAQRLAAHDPGVFARLEQQINAHMAEAMHVCRTISTRWLKLAGAPGPAVVT